MRIFCLKPDYSKFQGLEPMDDNGEVEACKVLRENRLSPVASRWRHFQVRVPQEDRDARPADFTTVLVSSYLTVFSKRAVEVLADLLEESGELLPLQGEGEPFHVFHPLEVVDALDLEHCKWQDDDASHIDFLAKYEFLPDRIGDAAIFKLLEVLDDGRRTARIGLFVTDRFVERVEKAGLAGFKFELVWPQEAVEAAKLAEAEKRKARKKKPAAAKVKKPPALTLAELGAIPWEPGTKPEMFPFLRHVWVTAVNGRMTGAWIEGVLSAAKQSPDDGLVGFCAVSLRRLLKLAADREDLCLLARSLIAEGVWWAFKMLDYPGVTSRDLAALADKLMEAAPRGRDGRAGGWPVRARRGSSSGEVQSPLKPVPFLRQIWKDAINDRMSGQWIDDVIQAAEQSPDQALTVTCADAVQRLLEQGAERDDLSHVARHQVAEGIRAGLRLLADPGVQEDDYDELANELLNAGPRGQDGLAGGWP